MKMERVLEPVTGKFDIDQMESVMYSDPPKDFRENLKDWLIRDYGMVLLTDAMKDEFKTLKSVISSALITIQKTGKR